MNQPDVVFEHLRAGAAQHLIVADHASNRVPDHLDNLGVNAQALQAHIAWDIGTAALAHALSASLNCEAIISNVSRLVIDKNRRLDQPGLMPDVSDGIHIGGNRNLLQDAVQARISQYYDPYHKAISGAVAARTSPYLISLHSFTPMWNGQKRPWDCGFLYNQHDALAKRAITHFTGLGLVVGDNEPYPGNVYNATMDRHAEAHGHPYLMLEVRNDLLQTPHDVALWCGRVAQFVQS